MIRRLAHLCFETHGLDKMVGFYTQILGLTVKFDFKDDQGERFGSYIDCGDSSFIEIFDKVKKSNVWGGAPTENQHGTLYNHLCFEITGIEDFVNQLKERGVAVSGIVKGIDHSKQAWTEDPDGNKIELMEYTASSLQIARTPYSL